MKPHALKAAMIDDDAFRVLAIPFSGPIPSPRWPGGVDDQGETFTPRTDIKPGWLAFRDVDWHHGKDPTGVMGHRMSRGVAPMEGRQVIGKAVDLEEQEDGWWVTVWLDIGKRNMARLKQLVERGGALFGSSEPIQNMVRVKADGEILVWPYLRQTLTTAPSNVHSVVQHMKADLTDVMHGGYPLTKTFWDEILDGLHDLRLDLPHGGAKARRVIGDLEEALAAADEQATRILDLYQSRGR